MAQSISLWGAQYSDVPGIDLPKTGGGTARFTDASVTTAVEADVASGKKFIKADGSIGTGTASGGGAGAIVITDTTDTHGGTIREITAVDISSDTVSAGVLLSGYTAHDSSGNAVTGSYVPSSTTYNLEYVWDTTYQVPDFDDTYATIKAAVQAGKTFSYTSYGDAVIGAWVSQCYYTNFTYEDITYSEGLCFWLQNPNDNGIYYCIYGIEVGETDPFVLSTHSYWLTNGTYTVTGPGTFDVPEYYAVQVSAGSAGTPVATKGTVSNHSVSITPSVTNSAGWISTGTTTGNAVTVSASELVSGTLNITSSGTKDVTTYASASVSAGTAGTPTASKGTVSNHSISITPSVTNTSGFITGGTKTGTAVTVSASELVSGSQTISQNGTVDVTNLASVTVSVSGGSSKNIQVYYGYASVKNNGYIASNATLTVAKTGTYKVSWVAWRSSSQGTMGTNLYKNGTAGTAQQTFTGTYGQQITLTNQSLNANDVLTIYATSGSSSRTIYIANFVIEEV